MMSKASSRRGGSSASSRGTLPNSVPSQHKAQLWQSDWLVSFETTGNVRGGDDEGEPVAGRVTSVIANPRALPCAAMVSILACFPALAAPEYGL